MSKIDGKIAVVTGGNSGIGFATAKEFKENGATVVITGRNEERIKKAASELGVKGIVADQGNLKHTDNLVAEIKKMYGNVDILFVNAGVFYPTPVGSIDETVFDTIMNINFKGAVFTVEKFLHVDLCVMPVQRFIVDFQTTIDCADRFSEKAPEGKIRPCGVIGL